MGVSPTDVYLVPLDRTRGREIRKTRPCVAWLDEGAVFKRSSVDSVPIYVP